METVAVVNNVDLDAVAREADAIARDPARGRRVNRGELEWHPDPAGPQMTVVARYENGELRLELDSPTFMGGKGSQPGPLHLCVLGLLSCFTATFVTAASARGIQLRGLRASGECQLDFGRVFGVSEAPAVQGVAFAIEADTDASPEELEAARQEALARCPAVFALSHPIPVTAEVRRAP
ncbi:MAG TPA: OsmC family protein [Dehalococcoidia bacterium]|nr:OsmC family protein [Dehalococcoidia bacterium]